VPVPDFVKAALQRMTFAEGSLPQALGRELLRMTGARVSDEAWAEAAQQVESHLRMNLEVVDGQGKFLGEGRDLAELTARFAEASQAALAVPQRRKASSRWRPRSSPRWRKNPAEDRRAVDDGVSGAGGRGRHGQGRALLDPGRSRVPAPPRLAALLMQQLAEPAKFLRGKLPGLTELGLLYRELGRVEALVEDILLASLDSCILEGEDPLPRDGAGWRHWPSASAAAGPSMPSAWRA
jgi:ATP-dependent helicase HrpA